MTEAKAPQSNCARVPSHWTALIGFFGVCELVEEGVERGALSFEWSMGAVRSTSGVSSRMTSELLISVGPKSKLIALIGHGVM